MPRGNRFDYLFNAGHALNETFKKSSHGAARLQGVHWRFRSPDDGLTAPSSALSHWHMHCRRIAGCTLLSRKRKPCYKQNERRKNSLAKGETKMFSTLGKRMATLTATIAAVLVSSPLLAAEAIPAGGESYTKVLFAVGAMIAAGFAIGVGAVGAGLGIGTAASGACSAVGRNPGVQGKIMMTMLVGMAMAESIAIYALVVSLVLLYANPYMKYFLVG